MVAKHDDEALGGTPVKLVRARWLLERFQAIGLAAAHLAERIGRFEGEAAHPTTFDPARVASLGVPCRRLEETARDLLDFFKARGDL